VPPIFESARSPVCEHELDDVDVPWQLVVVVHELEADMAHRLFNTALVSAMGLDAMSATTASIRQSIASRQAVCQANANLAASTDRLDAARAQLGTAQERLARARAKRAARA
jgi:flagellin-like hook-associated protein FlgL